MNYLVNFVLVIFKNIPPILRLNPFWSFIEIFGRGLNLLNEDYVYIISHTGQVTSLEHFLNGKYALPYASLNRDADIADKKIIYIDGPFIEGTFLYNKIELKPAVGIYNKAENKPLFLHNQTESNLYDFVICVPPTIDLTAVKNQLCAYADKYVIAGKRYIVKNY